MNKIRVHFAQSSFYGFDFAYVNTKFLKVAGNL
jgi:hypothetical protein